jgi:excinuclease ABC subunit B
LNKKIGNSLSKDEVDAFYETNIKQVAEESAAYMTKPELEKKIRETRKAMEKAAKELDFMKAAELRDAIKVLESNR